jgi:hypothetical protein
MGGAGGCNPACEDVHSFRAGLKSRERRSILAIYERVMPGRHVARKRTPPCPPVDKRGWSFVGRAGNRVNLRGPGAAMNGAQSLHDRSPMESVRHFWASVVTLANVGQIIEGSRRVSVLLLVLVLLAAMAIAAPLAHASPPDPVWISGYYDSADHDETVSSAAWGVGAASARTGIPRPEGDHIGASADDAMLRVGGSVALPPEHATLPRSPALPSRTTRSPPTA